MIRMVTITDGKIMILDGKGPLEGIPEYMHYGYDSSDRFEEFVDELYKKSVRSMEVPRIHLAFNPRIKAGHWTENIMNDCEDQCFNYWVPKFPPDGCDIAIKRLIDEAIEYGFPEENYCGDSADEKESESDLASKKSIGKELNKIFTDAFKKSGIEKLLDAIKLDMDCDEYGSNDEKVTLQTFKNTKTGEILHGIEINHFGCMDYTYDPELLNVVLREVDPAIFKDDDLLEVYPHDRWLVYDKEDESSCPDYIKHGMTKIPVFRLGEGRCVFAKDSTQRWHVFRDGADECIKRIK